MTVYVDDVRHPFGRMIMCHMWADAPSELLAMADRLGLARRWLQQPPKASWTHFDVSLSMKARAIAMGAVLTDRYGPSEHTAKLAIASDDAEAAARGERILADIRSIRERRENAP